MKKILLIGCGHMGNALLTSWINSKKYEITVVDPVKDVSLKKRYKNKDIKFLKSISLLKNIINFDIIIFAIKPINLSNILDEFSSFKLKSQISIVSVVAGKKIKHFEKKLGNTNNFFRVMPNMAASINESMNCIVSSKNVSKIKKDEITKLFSYSGKTIYLKNENEIDMATAISGSGPGFVFNLIDAMEKAANTIGFDKNISKTLVTQTFKGSVNLLSQNKLSAKELVKLVATKGGTTEAGLKVMKKNNIHKIFRKLTEASLKKSKDQNK